METLRHSPCPAAVDTRGQAGAPGCPWKVIDGQRYVGYCPPGNRKMISFQGSRDLPWTLAEGSREQVPPLEEQSWMWNLNEHLGIPQETEAILRGALGVSKYL